MSRPRPPHLQKIITRHKKITWYVRLGRGPKIRIKGVYGSPEFEAAYQDAVAGKKPQKPGEASRGTLKWLWDLYRGSSAWTDLSMATRKQRENIMRSTIASAGHQPLSKIDRAAILLGKERRAKTPTQAKHFVTTMRGMFAWAIDHTEKLVKTDPTQGIGFKRSRKDKTSGGFPVWTDDDITAFEKRWPRGTRERLMFDIFCYTGLRRGDAAVVGRQHVRDGVISIHTEKTGMLVTIPILAELQKTLDAGPTGDLTFIATRAGLPMTKVGLGNRFREACDAAGVKKSAHGIRKAAATRAANNGATTAQMNSIFGWEGDAMASLYTRSANRTMLAAGAMDKLARTEPRTSKPSPVAQVGALKRKAK
jgi:integrase